MDKELELKIEEFLSQNREAMIEVIKALVAIDSKKEEAAYGAPFGRGNKKVLEKALGICSSLGFETFNHEGYCGSAIWRNTEEEIGIFSHLDIVPAGEGWSEDPFKMRVCGDSLIGRGVSDNKGGFAAGLFAMLCMKSLDIPIKHTLRLFMGCDEESGMEDIDYFLQHIKAPRFSIVPDCGFPVCYGEKGILEGDFCFQVPEEQVIIIHGGSASNVVPDLIAIRLKNLSEDTLKVISEKAKNSEWIQIELLSNGVEIQARGVSAHAAAPEQSVNALYNMALFLKDIQGLPEEVLHIFRFIEHVLSDCHGYAMGVDHEDEVSGKLTAILGMIGQKQDEIRLNFNIRYPVTDSSARLVPILQDLADRYNGRLHIITASEPMYIPKEHPMVRQLIGVYNQVVEDDAEPYIMGGGTYARKLPYAVGFGPGCGKLFHRKSEIGKGGGHQPDEEANIAELLHAAKIYVMAIMALDELVNEQ